jgi:nicotinamide-nucleotide amidase
MDAEIIAVGSEMLTPQRVDTNSLYLTGELNTLGVEVVLKAVVGDHLERLSDCIRSACSRSGILILSGGLGPTEDDLTREATAQALDRRLVFHPEIAEGIEARFARMKRKMAEVNKRQAFVIEGAEILHNDRGTAPGQWVEDSGRVVVLLPGPPHELKAMYERQVQPRLARVVPKQVIRTLQMRVVGMPESDLDQLISPVYKKYENPATTILAAPWDIQVHLRARARTEGEGDALLAEVAGPIEQLLGDRIFSRNGEPLEEVVGSLLRQAHATISVAESATGGMLGERITSVSGSSDYFAGGFITYTNEMKTELLGVDPEILRQFGAVSEQVAEAMATGVRRRTRSTHALSITGVAGPDAGGESAPVGTMYVGLADSSGVHVMHRQFLGDRTRVRNFVVQMALDLLRRRLTKVSV